MFNIIKLYEIITNAIRVLDTIHNTGWLGDGLRWISGGLGWLSGGPEGGSVVVQGNWSRVA